MPPAEFEPAISVGERPQTHALDRAATGTGERVIYCIAITNLYVCTRFESRSFYQSAFSVVLTGFSNRIP